MYFGQAKSGPAAEAFGVGHNPDCVSLVRSAGVAALNTPHRASNPISAKSPRTLPSPREVSIGEFSTNAKRGRTSRMTRAISTQRPDRSPSIPAPFPAALMSWQGKPPETTSTRPRHGRPSKVVNVRPNGEGGEKSIVLSLQQERSRRRHQVQRRRWFATRGVSPRVFLHQRPRKEPAHSSLGPIGPCERVFDV
jgi:hypothetical protein